MEKVTLTLEDIRLNFGTEFAEKCQRIPNGDIKIFEHAKYGWVSVERSTNYCGTEYSLVVDNGVREDLVISFT